MAITDCPDPEQHTCPHCGHTWWTGFVPMPDFDLGEPPKIPDTPPLPKHGKRVHP